MANPGYHTDLTKHPVLSRDEEHAAVAAVITGDETARRLLIESNLRLAVRIARAYAPHHAVDDCIQEATIGLINAVDSIRTTYEPSPSARFITYAAVAMRRRVLTYLLDVLPNAMQGPCVQGSEEPRRNKAVSLDAPLHSDDCTSLYDILVGDDASTTTDQLDGQDLQERVTSLIAHAPVHSDTRKVMHESLCDHRSTKEIAEDLSWTEQRVTNHLNAGLRYMRHALRKEGYAPQGETLTEA